MVGDLGTRLVKTKTIFTVIAVMISHRNDHIKSQRGGLNRDGGQLCTTVLQGQLWQFKWQFN